MSCLQFHLIPAACLIPNTLQTFLSLLLILSSCPKFVFELRIPRA
jgi:hypothetical protein